MLIPVFFFFLQPFNNWLDGAKEDLLDIFIVHSVEEIQVIFNIELVICRILFVYYMYIKMFLLKLSTFSSEL